jgi:hypothetical protein
LQPDFLGLQSEDAKQLSKEVHQEHHPLRRERRTGFIEIHLSCDLLATLRLIRSRPQNYGWGVDSALD